MIWSWVRSGNVKIVIPIWGNFFKDSQDLIFLKVPNNCTLLEPERIKAVSWNNWISKDFVWLLPFFKI